MPASSPPITPGATTNALTLAGVTPTAAGLDLLDDASAAAQRATLGLGAAALLGAPVPVGSGGTGGAGEAAARAGLALRRAHDVVATDWTPDAGGGVYNLLAAPSPSGWNYTQVAGTTPTFLRLNADGSLEVDVTPAGVDTTIDVWRDFTGSDSIMWPCFSAEWTGDGNLMDMATDQSFIVVGFRDAAGTNVATFIHRSGTGNARGWMNYNIAGGSSTSTGGAATDFAWNVVGYNAALYADPGQLIMQGGSPLAPVHFWRLGGHVGTPTDAKWLGAKLRSTVRCFIRFNSNVSRPRIRYRMSALKVHLGV